MQYRPIVRIENGQPRRELTAPRRLPRVIHPGAARPSLLTLAGLEQFGRRAFVRVTDRAAETLFPNASSFNEPAIAGAPQKSDPLNSTAVFMAGNGNGTTRTAIQKLKQTLPSQSNQLTDKMNSFGKRHDSVLRSRLGLLTAAGLSVAAGIASSYSLAVASAFSFLPIAAPIWAPGAIIGALCFVPYAIARVVSYGRLRSAVRDIAKFAQGREKELAAQLGNGKKVDYLLDHLPQEARDKVAQELARLNGRAIDGKDSLIALELAYEELNQLLSLPDADRTARETEIAKLIEEITTTSKALGLEISPQTKDARQVPYLIVPANAMAKQKIKAMADHKNDKGLPDPEIPPMIEGGCFLGRGGMGEVYLVFNPHDQKHYAVKIMLPEHLGSPAAVASFQEEYDIQERINHPAVVNAFAFGRFEKSGKKSSDCPYFVMELIEGVDLDDYARKLGRPLNAREALVFVAKICEAMIAITGERVTHRDLKLSNIFVVLEGAAKKIKIGDFGLLANIDRNDKSATGVLKGTVTYMSPEYPYEYANLTCPLRDARNNSGTLFPTLVLHDEYAVGVILYRLLRGTPLVWEYNGQLLKTSTDLLNPGNSVDRRTGRAVKEISWLMEYAADFKAYREAKAAGDQNRMAEIKAKYSLLPLGSDPVMLEITALVQEITSIDPTDRPKDFSGLRDRVIALFNQHFPGETMDDSLIQADLITSSDISVIEEPSNSGEPTKPRLSGIEPTQVASGAITNPQISGLPTLQQLTETVRNGNRQAQLDLCRNIDQYIEDAAIASQLLPILQAFIKTTADQELKKAGRSAYTYLSNFVEDDFDSSGGTA